MFIFGLTGSLGSGCTTIAKRYLCEKEGYSYISISGDILKPLAEKYSQKFGTGEEKQKAGNYIRENKQQEYNNAIIDFINKSSNKVVIECFRNPIEIDFLRNKFPHFYLIALFAPKKYRKTRFAKQGKNGSNFEDLDKRDEGEKNKFGQQVRKCVTNADIVIDNSSEWIDINDANEFFEKFKLYLRLLKEPYRTPNNKEMFMHLAYSVSLRSKCIQRQTGTVITDEDYKVLSTGFNDVPKNSEPCIEVHSECYRKIKKRKYLLSPIDTINGYIKFCPACGEQLNLQTNLLTQDYLNESLTICNKCKKDICDILSPGKELDFCRSLHAEENAILSNPYTSEYFYKKNKKMLMFTTTFPCMLCSKKIANSGIKKVIFVEPYPSAESYDILTENDVTIEVFEGVKSLKFNWIFRERSKYIEDLSLKKQIDFKNLLKNQ